MSNLYVGAKLKYRIDSLVNWCDSAPMINWDHYRFILALHRAGSIRGAGSILGVNHATVSRRLAQLNENHDAPIFERTRGKYTVTRLGEPLLSAAEHMEAIALQAERQQRALDNTISGPITLSMAETIGQYLLRDDLIEFSHQYPNIELTVAASYQRVDLDRSEADVVVRGDNSPPEHLVGRKLFNYGLTYYAHKDYLAVTPEERRRWLLFTSSTQASTWVQNSPFPNAPVQMRVGDLTLLHQMALAKQGMILTACFIGDQSSELVRLTNEKPMPGQDFWVLTHPDLRTALRIKTLMQFLVKALMKKRELIIGNSVSLGNTSPRN